MTQQWQGIALFMRVDRHMPRFFFSYSDDGEWRDQEGVELPNAAAAEQEARSVLPRIMGDAIISEAGTQQLAIMVTDEQGALIYSAAMIFTGTRLPQ